MMFDGCLLIDLDLSKGGIYFGDMCYLIVKNLLLYGINNVNYGINVFGIGGLIVYLYSVV